MLLQKFIKKILAEVSSENAAHKQHIKSLFKNFTNKFSASYIHYRKQNYPRAWAIKTILYSEDYGLQIIKLLFDRKNAYDEYALIFEYQRSICVTNDKIIRFSFALGLPTATALNSLNNFAYLHKYNHLFKLSLSDFETALNAADNYDEFIMLCSSMNKEYKEVT